jgi:ankyrin repeat protein
MVKLTFYFILSLWLSSSASAGIVPAGCGVELPNMDFRGLPQAQKQICLNLAVLYRFTSNVERLIAAGADPESNHLVLAVGDDRAAADNDTRIVELLLLNGVDPNQVDKDGRQPLLSAVSVGFLKATKLLLDAGAYPNIKSEVGDTPLHIAVNWESIDLVNLILEVGADPNPSSNSGKTPLMAAVVENNNEIVKALISTLQEKQIYASVYRGQGYTVTITGFGSDASYNGCDSMDACLTIPEASFHELGHMIWEHQGYTYNMSPYDGSGSYNLKIFDAAGAVLTDKLLEHVY